MRSYLWIVFLVGCLVSTVYYEMVDNSGILFTVLSCARVPAAALGYLMYPRLRCLLKWLFLAVSVFAAGDLLAYNWPELFGTAYPFPSIADIPYLIFYPIFGYGILTQLKRWGVSLDFYPLLPVALCIAFVLTFWIAFESIPITLGLVVSALYPIGDILLLYCIWRMREVVSCTASALLMKSIGLLVVADIAYSWVTIHGTYQPPGALDWLWLVSYALMGAATLHPSMGERPQGYCKKGITAT